MCIFEIKKYFYSIISQYLCSRADISQNHWIMDNQHVEQLLQHTFV